jgi:MoaA/NifB/PqqE/SkfB family radical SAM enzyme
MPITARATLHRLNFRELPALIEHARAISLDGISFLGADVSSSTAFGRHHTPDASRLALTPEEADELEVLIECTAAQRSDDFAAGFVMEPLPKLRRIVAYYRALAGQVPFPAIECNAPYTSIVVEADGTVRPCFFHEPIGNIRRRPLGEIVTQGLPEFRAGLDVETNSICRRCVCAMKLGWRHAWA